LLAGPPQDHEERAGRQERHGAEGCAGCVCAGSMVCGVRTEQRPESVLGRGPGRCRHRGLGLFALDRLTRRCRLIATKRLDTPPLHARSIRGRSRYRTRVPAPFTGAGSRRRRARPRCEQRAPGRRDRAAPAVGDEEGVPAQGLVGRVSRRQPRQKEPVADSSLSRGPWSQEPRCELFGPVRRCGCRAFWERCFTDGACLET